ncbi:MAG: N-6 DNA methylase [Burkholderiales bacterium]|nr:N-6 DNA methylase [Opitutaceae bacterium]
MSLVANSSPSARKASGSHYTPDELARFVARQIIARLTTEKPRVLDPACGEGALLAALHARLPEAMLHGYDLDQLALEKASLRLAGKFEETDFLQVATAFRDELFAPAGFDAVIANPPYVRTQVMGAEKAQALANSFDLNGRVDLYFAFLEGIADVLVPGGIAGVIVSNRFMTTKSGALVRTRLLERFDVLHVWDLGDTKLFEAAVLPAVLLLRKKNAHPPETARFSTIYRSDLTALATAETVIHALESSGPVRVGADVFEVKHGSLDTSHVWRISTDAGDAWLEQVRRQTFCTFGDIGKIRVGIKTTADKVFVRKEWPAPRPELLRPLLNHKASRRYRPLPPGLEVLYTHEEHEGRKRAVTLDLHPVSRAYLETHRSTLEGRDYVMKSGRHWFEIWVPQQPSLWAKPKLFFPDISERPVFAMSLGGEIIQGDCYWLAAESDAKADWLWLALAVANSRFIEAYYDHAFNNRLYAGRRRFLTQYVERFPLPDPQTEASREIVRLVKRAYEHTPGAAADQLAEQLEGLIAQAFGVPTKTPSAS